MVVSESKIGLHLKFVKKQTNSGIDLTFSVVFYWTFLAARENSIMSKYKQRDLEIYIKRFPYSHHSIAHVLKLFMTNL